METFVTYVFPIVPEFFLVFAGIAIVLFVTRKIKISKKKTKNS